MNPPRPAASTNSSHITDSSPESQRRYVIRICVCLLLPTVAGFSLACPAFAARGHEFGFSIGWGVSNGETKLEICKEQCKRGIAGPGDGQFDAPVAVAVNETSGEFYVSDEANNRVERFNSVGEYLGQFNASGVFEVEGKQEIGTKPSTGQFSRPRTIAVDNTCVHLGLSGLKCSERDPSNGDVYVVDLDHEAIDKFTSTGNYIGQVPVPRFGSELALTGVAVDAKGDLWIAEEQGIEHKGFDEFDDTVENGHLRFISDRGLLVSCEAAARPSSVGCGLAIGREGSVFATMVFELPFRAVVEKFTSIGEFVNVVAQTPSTGVAVDHSSGDVFVDTFAETAGTKEHVSSVRRYTPETPNTEVEHFGEQQLIEGRGLAIDSLVVPKVREAPIYVTDSGAADVVVFPLEKPRPPTITGVSASTVTSSSATLRATVNPRGARTEYRFEYGRCPSATACASAPFELSKEGDGSVGGELDFEEHEVSVHPQALQASTVYHLRVSAKNALNATGKYVETGEVIFTTQAEVFRKSDLDGRGWEMVSPAQKHGTLITGIVANNVIQAASEGEGFTYVTASPTEDEPSGFSNREQIFSRRTKAGWASQDIGLSHTRATGQSIGQGGEYRLFSEDLSLGVVQPFGEFEPATSSEATEQTAYERTNFFDNDPGDPCVTNCYRALVTKTNAKAGFGEEGECPFEKLICGPVVAGANPSGSQVVLFSKVGLTKALGDNGGLYEWSDGVLLLASVLPNGTPVPLGSNPVLGSPEVVRGAVSSDGSHVVWSATVKGKAHLYSRDVVDETTVELDAGLTGVPLFQVASTDGARVFFTDNGELYVYEAAQSKSVRLTIPLREGDETKVQGEIAGISEDGSYVYFVADGSLDKETEEVEERERGKQRCGETGFALDRCYLYEMHNSGEDWGVPKLVAVLSGEDFPDFSERLVHSTIRVAPNGRWLAFMSRLPLTGYDNRDETSGVPDEEVFLWDSVSRHVTCASCDPTGARPVGAEYRNLEGGLVAGNIVWSPSSWLAANVPAWTPYDTPSSFYQSRYLSNSGRLFFNSNDALVPRDVNGTEDVYEFEPVGVGSCVSSSSGYVGNADGCVGLVSSGTTHGESGFLDASASGSDVFFVTSARLARSDFDSAIDVYDAHECRSASPCVSVVEVAPSPCVTEAACKASPSPQPETFGAPPSETFMGLGNVSPLPVITKTAVKRSRLLTRALRACRHSDRYLRRRRIACERRARARYAR